MFSTSIAYTLEEWSTTTTNTKMALKNKIENQHCKCNLGFWKAVLFGQVHGSIIFNSNLHAYTKKKKRHQGLTPQPSLRFAFLPSIFPKGALTQSMPVVLPIPQVRRKEGPVLAFRSFPIKDGIHAECWKTLVVYYLGRWSGSRNDKCGGN